MWKSCGCEGGPQMFMNGVHCGIDCKNSYFFQLFFPSQWNLSEAGCVPVLSLTIGYLYSHFLTLFHQGIRYFPEWRDHLENQSMKSCQHRGPAWRLKFVICVNNGRNIYHRRWSERSPLSPFSSKGKNTSYYHLFHRKLRFTF